MRVPASRSITAVRLTAVRLTAVSLVAVSAAVLCACGSTRPAAPGSVVPSQAASAGLSMAQSVATAQAAWAVLPMGAAAAGPNQFWQLFRRPSGGGGWYLQTPPDVATNGAIALAGLSGSSVTTGVLPSLYLSYSPVSQTGDGGQDWTAGPPAPGLASVPDTLAATAGGGQLLALGKTGQVSVAVPDGSGWTGLTTLQSLAGAASGRACGVTRLTAVAYSSAAVPLVGAACGRPGVTGIFARAGSGWQAAGPSLPAALAGDTIRVLRLVTIAGLTTALLQGTGGGSSWLAVAWLEPDGKWSVSAPRQTGSGQVVTTAFGGAGSVAVVMSGGGGAILPGPRGAWQQTPPVPAARSVVIVPAGAGGSPQALGAGTDTLTVWRLDPRAGWVQAQTVKVPIQYGSSN